MLHPSELLGNRKGSGRWDIQGLRAFAVLAVVADHLTGWPSGGFVGVDVFFVISGFLITGLLLREHEKDGRISFSGFYRRRVKRIIPAALLVLAATTIAGYLTFNSTRAAQTATDSLWAALFGANWRMMSLATDYFNADGAVSPVQHYWSLSIEEQFYFVWPALMVALYLIARRGSRVVVGTAMAVIVGASFAWAVMETGDNPTRAYFDTFARVWELGVGALLAVCVPLLFKIPDALRPVLAWVGLAAMTASLWLVSADQGFPAPWAALPVIATALVIAAGTHRNHRQQQRLLFPLTNRVSNYVGDMSYSLYLWHFPIIVIGTTLWGDSTAVTVALLIAMLVISVASYELVEDPIRKSEWLTPAPPGRGGSSRKKKKSGSRGWQAPSGRFTVVGMGFLFLVVATLVGFALRPVDPPTSALGALPPAEASPSSNVDPAQPTPKLAALQLEISSALSDTSWPDNLSPSMDDSIGAPIAPAEISACADLPDGPAGPADCAWGPENARHTAVLVGDSVAIAYADALRAATLARGWRFLSRPATACPFVDQAVNVGEATFNPNCEAIKAATVRDIKALKPDVLFVANHRWSAPDFYPDEWVDASKRELAKTGDAVGRVVVIAGPPPTPDPAECYTPASSPADCTGGPAETWQAMYEAQQVVVEDVGGLQVNTTDWFCYRTLCPPYIGGVPVRPDSNHVLPAYMTGSSSR